jgi:hypothetical protein
MESAILKKAQITSFSNILIEKTTTIVRDLPPHPLATLL